jgi:cell division protein FtsB
MNFKNALFILVVLLLLSGVHLFIYIQNISLNYHVTDVKIKLSELKSQSRLRGAQVARAENLDYVERAAKEKLGMIYPEKVNYIIAGTRPHPTIAVTMEANPEQN